MAAFRVGVTPDFFTDAKGKFEAALEERLGGVSGLETSAIPKQPEKTATPAVAGGYDAIFALGLKFPAESLAAADRLTLIARWGVGYDMIDVEAMTRADVALAITPNAVRVPVAEAIFTLIFAVSKNLIVQDRATRRGKWRGDLPRMGVNLRGRVLGSIGCGNIASEMFRMAKPLGFRRLIAHDPYISDEKAARLGVERVGFDGVFRESDYVVVNTPLNQHTRGMIGEAQLRLMKPAAYLINAARGPIVQQAALVRALEEGWIAGAGLDVLEQEPPPPQDPILRLDNVVLAPHGLAWTEELARDNTWEACDNILAVYRGEPPPGLVNREVLERPGFRRKLERLRAPRA